MYFCLAESIKFHIICECSNIRGSQVSQPSGQMYLYNDCSSERLSFGKQELQKLFSPLHLGGILGENLWYPLTAFPLVSKYHQPDTIPEVQYPSSKPTEGGQWVSWGYVGSFCITCTISLSCPGHYLCGPYGGNLGLPLVLSCYHQTLPLDLGVLVNLLEEVLGYCLNQLSMSSSSDSWVLPSVHQACYSLIPRKALGFEYNDLRTWRFFFGCFLWFSALEIPKILFWISSRIFWSSSLSWIGASFNRRFSILCSNLNFPFCICYLFGCFPSVLSFLSVKPLQTNVIYTSIERCHLLINGTIKTLGEQKRKLLV